MSRVRMIQPCAAQVQEVLPELPRPEPQALAQLVDGVLVSGHVGLRAACGRLAR